MRAHMAIRKRATPKVSFDTTLLLALMDRLQAQKVVANVDAGKKQR